MKRAPVIPRHTTHTQSTEDTSSPAPAAPMVDSLIARVGAMARGNAISLPVCGREVKFTLEVLRGDSVESASRVWSGNERDQELLTEDALDDLIPSFLLTGQQTPAFGRRVSDVIEIADGSRRRKAAILTKVIIAFWLVNWTTSRWLHCPGWVTIIGRRVLMNVACVIQAGCRMSLPEIFLRLPMRKTSLVRSLPAVSIRPNCLNQLLPCLHIPRTVCPVR